MDRPLSLPAFGSCPDSPEHLPQQAPQPAALPCRPGQGRPTAGTLLLAAFLTLPACDAGNAEAPSQVVAQVNGEEISIHQVNQLLQNQPPAADAASVDRAARQALDRLIEQELAVQLALDQSLDRDPAVMQALTAARREVLARAWMTRVAAGVQAPTAAELRAEYDRQPALFAQRQVFELQELVVPLDSRQFESLKQVLLQARRFDEVAAHLRAQGLPLQATRLMQPAEALPAALLQRVLAMRDGQAVLLGAPGAARIVARVSARAEPISFEAARPRLERQWLLERQGQAVRTGIQLAAERSRIERLGPFASAASAAATMQHEPVGKSEPPGSGHVAPAAAQAARSSTPDRDKRPSLLPPPAPEGSHPPQTATPPAAVTADDDSVRRGLSGLR